MRSCCLALKILEGQWDVSINVGSPLPISLILARETASDLTVYHLGVPKANEDLSRVPGIAAPASLSDPCQSCAGHAIPGRGIPTWNQQKLVGCESKWLWGSNKSLVFTVYLVLVAGFPKFNQQRLCSYNLGELPHVFVVESKGYIAKGNGE